MAKLRLTDLPFVPPDGFIDMKSVPLGSNFQRAVGEDREAAIDSLRVLQSASYHGRKEASVFLAGFLVSLPADDWEMRRVAVEALRDTRTEGCASLLFWELRRVKCSNTTRRYVNTILEVLTRFPEELVGAQLRALAEDRMFSAKMRSKLRACSGMGVDLEDLDRAD